MSGRLPNLLIVGVQKSGTSHAHATLAQSPDIHGSEPKELNFFNRVNCAEPEQQALYRAHFPAGREKYYLESTPHYFRQAISDPHYSGPVVRSVPDSILSLLPRSDLKLIAVLRNPVERAISATIHHTANRRLSPTACISEISSEHGIVARGYYGAIVREWRAAFSDQLHLCFYDQLESNPSGFYHSLCGWLGVGTEFLAEQDLGRRANSSATLVAKANIERPSVSPAVIRELCELYHADIADLECQLERDFSHWLEADKLIHKWCK